MTTELINTKRTYNNVIKYLSVHGVIQPLGDSDIQQEMIVNRFIKIAIFDAKLNKNIIACITKHDTQTTHDNKLIAILETKLNLTSIKNNTDVLFILYDTDCYDKTEKKKSKIEKHKKKIQELETKYRAQNKQFNINFIYLSYNIFKYSLEERLADGIINYEIISNEEEFMQKNDLTKGELPIIRLNEDPILILKYAKVGQIVKEYLFNRNAGQMITYKRVI